MAHNTLIAVSPQTGGRYDELKRMLLEKQREISEGMQSKMHDIREGGADKDRMRIGPGEICEADIQDDIEFALVEMQAETLRQINDALARLEEGSYGNCFECGEEISEARLRALPFAVRCKDCEEAREMAQQMERAQQRKGSVVLGFKP